jgi:hypothetical protein
VRSYNAVDHFRPKNSVAECKGHTGYWWLAFDWTNYRFSCTFCNTYGSRQARGTEGGKHNHFPLWDDSRRAWKPKDRLLSEQPLLLDPISASDPPLLWFDPDGSAVPHPRCGAEDSYLYSRARNSIRFYHLNQPDILERRQAICRELIRLVDQADLLYSSYEDGDMTARAALASNLAALRNAISEKAEYSATARAMLMELRGRSQVADLIGLYATKRG